MVTQNSWNAPNPTLDGELLIGKTSTGHPVVNTLTPGTGIDIANGSGSVTISTNLSAFPNQNNIIYVSKAGNDLNSGLNIENAVLTFGQAIVLANAAVPSSTNRFTIMCFDDGIYVEDITLPSFVDLCACNAELEGTLDLNDSISIKFRAQHVLTGLIGISQNSGGTAYICINEVLCDGTAAFVECASGFLGILWENIIIDTGTCFNANGGDISLNGGVVQLLDVGTVIKGDSNRQIVGSFAGIVGNGNGSGIVINDALNVNLSLSADIDCDQAIVLGDVGATVNLTVNTISANTDAYYMTDGTLNLICNRIVSGARTVAGGTEHVTIANPMGNQGQIWTSSGPTVDPVWADLTSTTLTINTATPGTVSIDTDAVLQTDTGFGAWAGGGPYFDDTTLGSFILLQGGSGYINGVPVSWTAPQTVTGLTAGNTYYMYINSAGALLSTPTRSDALYQNNIVLFECLRDSTSPTNNQVTVKENHPYGFPVETSNYLHEVINSVIEDSGANIVLNGTLSIQINGADELNDHGIMTSIPDSGGSAITWQFYYTNAGGKWVKYTSASAFPGVYNNAGTITALTGTRRAIFNLYASKDSLNTANPFYYAVIDTTFYSGLAAATTAIGNGTYAKTSGELAQLEFVQLGQIIYGFNDNTIQLVNINKTTFRSSTTTSGTNTASLVNTVTTNFNNVLTAADTNVQASLDTINNLGGGVYWNVTAATTITPVVSNGYATTAGTLVTATLPATVAVGRVFEFLRTGAGNWHIAQQAGQTIHMGTSNTTTGATGYLESTAVGDRIKLLCTVANTDFYVLDAIGDITVF